MNHFSFCGSNLYFYSENSVGAHHTNTLLPQHNILSLTLIIKHTVCKSFRGILPEDHWVHVHKTDQLSLCCHEASVCCWDVLRNVTRNGLRSSSSGSRPLMCKALLEEKHFDSSHKLIFGQLQLFAVPH